MGGPCLVSLQAPLASDLIMQNLDIVKVVEGCELIYHNLPAIQIDRHEHDRVETIIPISGAVELDFDGDVIMLKEGDMIFIRPEVPHAFIDLKKQGDRLILLLAPKFLSSQSLLKNYLVRPSTNLIQELFLLICSEDSEELCCDALKLLIGLFRKALEKRSFLLRDISEQQLANQFSSDDRLARLLRYFKTNYNHESFDLGEAARFAGLSVRSMHRLLKNQTEFTANQLLHFLRIEAATQQLQLTAKNPHRNCYHVGYQNFSTFIKQFMALTGNVPSSFRGHTPKNL